MNVSTCRRLRLILTAVAFLFAAGLAVEPRIAGAQNTLGHDHEYGVFISHVRHEVSRTPIAVPFGHAFRVQGWVLDSRTMKPGKSLRVATDGAPAVVVRSYPLARPDVVAALHDPGAAKSGFELTVPKLAVGVHRLHFILIGNDGTSMDLSSDVLVSIGQ